MANKINEVLFKVASDPECQVTHDTIDEAIKGLVQLIQHETQVMDRQSRAEWRAKVEESLEHGTSLAYRILKKVGQPPTAQGHSSRWYG